MNEDLAQRFHHFKGFNKSNDDKCPICKTNKDNPVILVPIPGTEDGNIVEAQQVHLSCAIVVLNSLEKLTDE